jgi:hypothetical protein
MSNVQETVSSICARPLQSKFLKHLSNEIYAHYKNLTPHTEIHWPRKEKALFRLQEVLLATVDFLQNRGVVPLPLKDMWQLLHLPFLTDLPAE